MRTFRIFSVLAGTALLSVSAIAAENGMYRPGNPYFSNASQSPDQCAAMCRGDGTCQGWNFVKIRQSDSSGVCELNARHVAPVASAISISGDNTPTRVTARLVPSGTRTVRVGTIPNTQPGQTVRVGQVPQSKPATRRVVRKLPPPAQQQASPAIHRKPAQPQQQVALPTPRPQFRHSLDSAPMPPQQRPAARPQPETPKSHHTKRLQELIARQQAAAQSAPQTAQAPAQGSALPPRMPRPQLAPNAPATIVQESLFGSLYDDVKAPNAIGPEDIPVDADAPIATVASVPSKTVTTENLMAGAAPTN